MIDIVALITAAAPIVSTVAGLILNLVTYLKASKIHQEIQNKSNADKPTTENKNP